MFATCKRMLCAAGGMIALAGGASVFAGTPFAPTLSVGFASGPPGTTRSVGFTVDSGGSNLGGVQMELAVPAGVRAVAASASGPGMGVGVACGSPTLDRLICLVFNNGGAALPANFAFQVQFSVDVGTSFGIYPLNLVDVQFSDPNGVTLPSGTNSNGFFQVTQAGPPVFSSQPAPAVLIDWGNVVHDSFAERTVRIANVAMPDFQPLTLNACIVSGSTAWALQQPSALPLSIPAGSAVDVVVRMNSSSTLPALVQGSLDCQLEHGAISASWPLRASAVPDALFVDGLE